MFKKTLAVLAALMFVGIGIGVLTTPKSHGPTRLNTEATVGAMARSQGVDLQSESMSAVIDHKRAMFQWIRDRLPF
jgi:hypothetical protein